MEKMHAGSILAKPEVRSLVNEVVATLRHVLPPSGFADRERAALEIGNELVRCALEDDLRELSAGYGDDVRVDGVLYRRHEDATVTYHGLVGPMAISRATYRKVGVRNGPTVVPLELETGLVEHATPALALSIAHGYALHDMRQHLELLAAAQRNPPSRTTLERIARRTSSTAVASQARIERALRRAEAPPAGAVAIAIGLDRTSTAMVESRAANAPPKATTRRKPLKRRPPAPFDVNWRMAYVGTVSFVDENGEAIRTIRYASPACDDPTALVDSMTADCRVALRRTPTLGVGIVQDGAPEMWNRTREGLAKLKEEGGIGSWEEGIDRYHLMERLAEALALIEPAPEVRRRTLDEWKERFDSRDSTIDSIETFLLKAYPRLTESGARTKLWEHLGYIRRNKDRMRYVTLRLAHLPVGSGVTESAAKTVIALRAKRSGQRWREPALRGVLTLRAVHQSGRFPAFWRHLSRCYTARVEAA
jgi:hypothetical protein